MRVLTCSELHGHYSQRAGEITLEYKKVQGEDGAEFWRIAAGPAKGDLIPTEPVACDELGPGIRSQKYENNNKATTQRVRTSRNLEDVAATYGVDDVVYDAVLFWKGLYLFRVENGSAKGTFVQVDLDDVAGADASILDRAFSNYVLYSVFGDAWKWRFFHLGVGSAAAPVASDVRQPSVDVCVIIPGSVRSRPDARTTEEAGSAPPPTTSTSDDDEPSPRRVPRADGTCAFLHKSHCLQGAVLNALRDFPTHQRKLERAFFDKQKQRMLHSEIGDWLALCCGHVQIEKLDPPPSIRQLLRLTGADDKYVLSLHLANGADHAIALDYAWGLTYDTDGGDYHDTSLVDGLHRLEESGAKIVYAAKLLVAEPGGSKSAKRKRKRGAQEN